MIRVYIAAAFVAALFLVYGAGVRAGRDNCRANVAAAAVADTGNVIQQIKEIDNVVIKTDTDNIRRVLREQYTIGE